MTDGTGGQPRRVIIDTDPGADDAMALLLALACPELAIEAVTTVAGNVPLPLTTRNAQGVLALAGDETIPVHAGADRPLAVPLHTAEAVHGDDGIGGEPMPDRSRPVEPRHAVTALAAAMDADSERNRADPVTLVAVGPQTNVALALAQLPRDRRAVRELVIMGGSAFRGGNSTPAAEFNMLVDPEAAAMVFDSGLPITLVPLDLTHQVLASLDWLDRLAAQGDPIGPPLARIIRHYGRFDEIRYGRHGAPLHDPCTIAWLVAPELFQTKSVSVAVETAGHHTRGMTVVDWWGITGRPANCRLVHGVQADAVLAWMLERLGRLARAGSV